MGNMFSSIRSKLIVSILGVSFVVGAVSLMVGGQLLYTVFLNEATNRTTLDLNAAREIYLNQMRRVEVALNTTTLGSGFRSALNRQDTPELINRLKRLAQQAELDFAGIITQNDMILCRIGPHAVPTKKTQVTNTIASQALKERNPVVGTVILSKDFLWAENPVLADQANIPILPTPRAAPVDEEVVEEGMALAAAIPVLEGTKLIGVLYGGVLLNQNFSVVDQVRGTVFQHEIYKGRNIGTATIFLNDVRISTNVLTPGGERAIGTRVSQEVKNLVLDEGEKWTGRAFVVSDWYITAYEPIEDIFGKRVGMLYVGVLEAKYTDIRTRTFFIFFLLTIIGVLLAIGLGYFMASKILRPVHRLVKASNEVSHGNFSPEIGPISKSEIGMLQATFRSMLASLQERDKRMRAEHEIKLLQSEQQASIGRLAAGVAHEINNPLTGVLTFTHMLLQRGDVVDDIRSDLKAIAQQTERVRSIVKNLLGFSRQTEINPEPTDVNRVVSTAVLLMRNQALVKGVSIKFKPGEDIPPLVLDANQMQSVILNLLLNALDATKRGDSIMITTGISGSGNGASVRGVEIHVKDTGCGIPPENLDKLFAPFFTTKEVGQGTGLGLAVSSGIVQRHGGSIKVQSTVGKGSTFTVWLPLEDQYESDNTRL
ncbi:MAG: cache domain-containing protein [Deltaproteobacteria bacterium]|nr:cache domain-containing protein [Deltaproteobacteria bacterium]